MTDALAEHIASVGLVDHHVHGYWLHTGLRRDFENGLNEANTEPLADFDSGFDTQLGFAVRAHCAALLRLPAHTDPDAYWASRAAVPDAELGARFLSAAGVTDWLVDTGFGTGISDLPMMAAGTGTRVHEIVRLESVAEDAVNRPGEYAEEFRAALAERCAGAVATKSILAYRGGLRGDLSEPSAGEVRRPHSAGARPAAAGSPTGCCCGSVCIRRFGSASPCSSTSGSATATPTSTRLIRCTSPSFCATPDPPR
jgi:predicted TIM-barrel fold metal-dependent hydrolase